jgi:hypothetical protein
MSKRAVIDNANVSAMVPRSLFSRAAQLTNFCQADPVECIVCPFPTNLFDTCG